jgi:hypothetical protein
MGINVQESAQYQGVIELAGDPQNSTLLNETATVVESYEYNNLTPTIFFDSNAIGSTGVGTFKNPFRNQADFTAVYGSGDKYTLSGQILGIKRGLHRSKLSITGIANNWGTYNSEFIICPYGDADMRPELRGAVSSAGWLRWPTDNRIWYKAHAAEQEFYDATGQTQAINFFRYFKVASTAALQAIGPGYACYTGGNSYIFPLEGTNPNSNYLEETFGSLAIVSDPAVLYLSISNGYARVGYVHVYGLDLHCGRNDVVDIVVNTGGSSAIVEEIVVDDCIIGFSGSDSTGATGGSDGLNLIGKSDAVRLRNCRITNNYFHDLINNSVELRNVDNSIISNNISTNVGGNSISELWGSCSDNTFKYNKARNTANNTYTAKIKVFDNGGIWIPGYVDNGGAGSENQTKNVNNTIAFNHIYDCKGVGLQLGTGEAKVYNNTIIAGNSTSNAVIRMGNVAGGQFFDAILSNNIFYNDNWSGTGNAMTLQSRNSADVIRGNNNILSTVIGRWQYSIFRGTDYLTTSSGQFDNMLTAIAAVTAGAWTETKQGYINFNSNSSGAPLSGSKAANTGTTIQAGYFTDLSGAALTGQHIGAYNPANASSQ